MTLIKICGITNLDDAIASVNMGASMLGFVFAESPRQVDPRTVKNIQRVIGADVKTIGVFTEESDYVLRIMDDCELTYAQLHGGQSEEFARRIGAQRVIRAARMKDEGSINELAGYESARFYLLDTYKKGVPGGTGEVFDWQLAVKASSLGKLIILSGGLAPGNILEAIRVVKPFAVDVSSGVEESPGKKDHTKIKEFIDYVRNSNSAS